MAWFFGKKDKKEKEKQKNHRSYAQKGTITCPYCMAKVAPKDILFMVDKSDGQVDEVFYNFASRYQGYNPSNQLQAHTGELLKQNDTEYGVKVNYDEETNYPVSISWQRNGGEKRNANTRVCPHCHCYLPTDIEKMDTKNIVLLGSTSCGKTTLIAGMLYMLVGNLAEENYAPHVSRNIGKVSIEKDSLAFASQMMAASLLGAEREPTQIARPIFPIVLVAQDAMSDNRTLVTIHDFAGEGLKDPNYFINHPIGNEEYVTDGIIYTIDCCQLPDLSNYNIAHRTEASINDEILNFSHQQLKVLSRADAVAVVLTKFDIYTRFVSQNQQGHVFEPLLTSHNYGVSINTIKDVSNSVKRILDPNPSNKIVQQQIEKIFNRKKHGTANLEDVEYFATACLKSSGGDGMGEENTATATFDNTCLHRVCEPLMYMFAKWGIFTVNK